jgi:hypothetical protein
MSLVGWERAGGQKGGDDGRLGGPRGYPIGAGLFDRGRLTGYSQLPLPL